MVVAWKGERHDSKALATVLTPARAADMNNRGVALWKDKVISIALDACVQTPDAEFAASGTDDRKVADNKRRSPSDTITTSRRRSSRNKINLRARLRQRHEC